MTDAKAFRRYIFELYFDPARLLELDDDQHLQRIERFLDALAPLHPVLENWYLCGDSLRDALSHNVTEHRQDLAKALSRDRRTRAVELVLWNGEEDPLKGGLSLDYEASGRAVSTRLQLEDAGSLLQVFDAPASSFVAIFLAALEIWPESTWGMLAPYTYFVHQRTFPDRRSIGWIGFCPHPLRATDFPAATELVDIPGRGTLLLNGREPMDETRREHFERVGEADIKLMELGYLPPLRG
ncbi:type VI secretion system immunity protein TsiT [Pseudomonas aeruginosa]|uniref:type VI secretion system immunity protein TsiT n=1 Tax=Pseudomonas aeruginosa TaxID=287 RepID=UPI000FC3FAFD|nr:type VI secretion system immunity protein TsiT [Pseudomonas aeruginosa]RUI30756.1 hypothetical protein IPC443_08610 [Pseudomonas aeruginosa]